MHTAAAPSSGATYSSRAGNNNYNSFSWRHGQQPSLYRAQEIHSSRTFLIRCHGSRAGSTTTTPPPGATVSSLASTVLRKPTAARALWAMCGSQASHMLRTTAGLHTAAEPSSGATYSSRAGSTTTTPPPGTAVSSLTSTVLRKPKAARALWAMCSSQASHMLRTTTATAAIMPQAIFGPSSTASSSTTYSHASPHKTRQGAAAAKFMPSLSTACWQHASARPSRGRAAATFLTPSSTSY